MAGKPERPDMLIRINMAEPAPLGLFGVCGGCIILFMLDFEATEGGFLAIPWLFYVPGFLQLIAGTIDFMRHNVFGGTAFLGYSMFWFGLANTMILEQKSSAAVRPDPARQHLGVMAVMYLIFSVVLTVLSLGLNKTFFSVLFAIDWTLLFIILHIFEDLEAIWVGVGLVFVFTSALYGFVAILLLKIANGEILPIGAPFINLADYIRNRELKDEVAAAAVEAEPIAVVIGPDGKPMVDPHRSGHMHRFNPNAMANTGKGRHVINERLLASSSSRIRASMHPSMIPHFVSDHNETIPESGSRAKLKATNYDQVTNGDNDEMEMVQPSKN